MKTCSVCHQRYEGDECPRHSQGDVSVGDDSLDSMVQAASVPNLASLFRKAKDSGAITSVPEYGGQSQTSA